MLNELNINEKIFLYECLVKADVVEYNLYDGEECWTGTKTKEELTKTLQLLNKRIKYDAGTAYDTLQNAQPESAVWAEATSESGAPESLQRVLKLKYRVKSCPFNFEWYLRKQDNSLHIQLPANQVASLVEILPRQIDELLDVLRRKEDEIRQYRMEYGNLRRSTLATKPFDVEKFRAQYAATDLKVKSLQKIITRWRAEHVDADLQLAQDVEMQSNVICSPKTLVKKEEPETGSPSTRTNLQESPRSRKRKAMQAQKAQLTRKLQTSKPKLIYESQSQSLSENEQMPAGAEVENVVATTEFDDNGGAKETAIETNKNKNALNSPIRDLTSKTAKAGKSPLIKDTNVTVPTNTIKKSSPPSESRPNTRQQRRRECDTPDSSSSELMIIENPIQNEIYTVDECAEPAENIDVPNVAIVGATTPIIAPKHRTSTTNKLQSMLEKVKAATKTITSLDVTSSAAGQPRNALDICSTPTMKKCKVEPPAGSDISSYVDSVLSQLDAFDRELKSQLGNGGIV